MTKHDKFRRPWLAGTGAAHYNQMFQPTGRSFNGRTADSDSAYRGSNPCLPATHSAFGLVRAGRQVFSGISTRLRSPSASLGSSGMASNPCLRHRSARRESLPLSHYLVLRFQLPLAAFGRLRFFSTSRFDLPRGCCLFSRISIRRPPRSQHVKSPREDRASVWAKRVGFEGHSPHPHVRHDDPIAS